MATSDPLMPASENIKTPQIYQLESGKSKAEARYNKDNENVNVQATDPETIAFVGLTKDQLEEYRNDPFWKPLRMIMFVLFWLIWIAMFAGAIVIVVLSPKCAAKSQPKWWQTKVSYQLFTPAFRDSNGDGNGDINGIIEKLENLRKIGIQTVWPTPLIDADQSGYNIYDVIDFENIDSRLGTLDDFKNLVTQVHDKGMYLVMDLPLTTTSIKHQWFESAKRGNRTYRDYYIWSTTQRNGSRFWTKADNARNEYYLHYENNPNLPILNWSNEKVRQQMANISMYWLDLGVDGFHVEYVEYLSRDDTGASTTWSESIQRFEAFESAIAQHLNSSSDQLFDKEIVLFSTIPNITVINHRALINTGELNYLINQELSADCDTRRIASCLHAQLTKTLSDYDKTQELYPLWELSNPFTKRLTTRVGNDGELAQLLTFVHLLLPGAIKFYYGDEIGMADSADSNQRGYMQWDKTANGGFSSLANLSTSTSYETINWKDQFAIMPSPLKTFQKLAMLRKREEVLIIGSMRIGQLQQQNAFVFSRAIWNNTETIGTIYLAAVNFGTNAIEIDWHKSGNVFPMATTSLDKAQVVAVTANFVELEPRRAIDLSTPLKIGPKQGALFKI